MSNKKVSMEKTSENTNKPRFIGGYVSTDLVEVMLRAFRHALNNVEVMKQDLSDIKLNEQAYFGFNSLKYRLNKYQIFGSDCSWRSMDPELQHVTDMIDFCNKLLLQKSDYTLGDVAYVYMTIDEIERTIKRKKEELERFL